MIDKKIFELDLCGEMLYRSPIQIIEHEIVQQMQMQLENDVLKIVHSHNIQVDKDELIKALEYDRGQYEKGFIDGSKVNKWIPCSERLPKEDGKYLATGIKGSVYIAEFHKGVINGKPVSLWCRSGGYYCNVIAWMELPPAYEGE